MFDPLNDELVKIAHRLEPHGVKLIIGGGYGLILKTQQISNSGIKTRLDIPPARSTEDIDLFLRLEIITDIEKMEAIRDTLYKLAYKPVAEFFQFETVIELSGGQGTIKVDLLAPSPRTEVQFDKVKISKPRIRPKNAKDIHAYMTEEAITIEEGLTAITLSYDQVTAEVFLPHPYTYLILKLFALRDHLEKEKKPSDERSKIPKAHEHAFDIYRIVSMLTEQEWNEAKQFANKYRADKIIVEALEITSTLFGSVNAEGSFAVRRHTNTIDFIVEISNLQKVLDDLHELFVS